MSELRITHKAFAHVVQEDDAEEPVSTLVVEWAGADGLSDAQVCEAVFHQTNTYRGDLWDAIQPLPSPRRTHTALSVGDEVTVRGTTYRCEPAGWEAVAVGLAAHEALLDELLGAGWRDADAGGRF